MMQPVEVNNFKDVDGNPAGGDAKGLGIDITFQNGPLMDKDTGERKEPNGAFVEGIVLIALRRLQFFQQSKFNCRENSIAITKLEEALHWLNHRTADREARQVEGTHAV